MSSEQQRIAIAKYFGWEDIIFRGVIDPKEMDWVGKHESCKPDGYTGKWQCQIPDYLNNLNEMWKIEKTLADYGDRAMYLNNIYGIMGRDEKGRMFDESIGSPIDVVPFASAVQRAEAFLRTMNLWKN